MIDCSTPSTVGAEDNAITFFFLLSLLSFFLFLIGPLELVSVTYSTLLNNHIDFALHKEFSMLKKLSVTKSFDETDYGMVSDSVTKYECPRDHKSHASIAFSNYPKKKILSWDPS